MIGQEKFARWAFGLAAAYGALVLGSLYFHAPVGDAAYYYGFVGSALVMQAVYVTIASAPLHYRALMPIGVAAKLSFAIPCAILFARGQLEANLAIGGAIDMALAILFAACWLAVRRLPR